VTIDLTYPAAVDAIFNRFNTDWNDGRIATLLTYQPTLYFQGIEKAPDFSKLWARISQQTVIERQASLSAYVGAEGKRRYETTGLVFVQLFSPKKAADSFALCRAVATICRDAFRGKYAAPIDTTLAPDNRVTFYNAKISELDSENDSFRFNVSAQYEYDELG
jgi:hypothetical protein